MSRSNQTAQQQYAATIPRQLNQPHSNNNPKHNRYPQNQSKLYKINNKNQQHKPFQPNQKQQTNQQPMH